MATVKTIILTGSEVKVTALGGQNVAVKNLGSGSVYASVYPNIVPDADNVVEIPAGWGETVLDARGTVYLFGVGKVQCTGTDYATPNFKVPSASEGGGGGTGDVTKAYVDAQDSINFAAAKAYADQEINAVKGDVGKNTDDISALKTGVSVAAAIASAAQTAADEAGEAATNAQTAADTNAGNISAIQEAVSAVQAAIADHTAAITDNTSDIAALQSALSTAQTDIVSADEKAEAADVKAAAAQTKAETALSAVEDIAAKSVMSENGAFDLRYSGGELQGNEGGEWFNITTGSGGTTGGVSQAYVDARDADTLTNANTYTDSKISPLQIAADDNTNNISALTRRVAETEGAIDTLNGTGNGSVKKTIADEIAAIIAGAPESFDTLEKIAAWIEEHPEDTAAMNMQIQQNKQDIADINNETAGILAKAKKYTNEQLDPVNSSISNLQAGKADKTDIPTTLPANGGNADTVGGHTVGVNVPQNANFYAPNPNLLDNWYFADPVNQRDITTQTGGGSIVYGIDRWGFYGNSHPVLSILDDCIEIDNTLESAENTCGLVQRLEASRLEVGRVYTLSVMAEILQDQSSGSNSLFALSNGTDKSQITASTFLPRGANGKFEVFTHTFTLPEAGNDLYNFRIRSSAGLGKIKIKAMKLELGGSQTLAHKEGDEWVLNDPPPNKALELAKCQRYQVVYRYGDIGMTNLTWVASGLTVNDTTARFLFNVPTTMYTDRPTIINNGFKVFCKGIHYDISSTKLIWNTMGNKLGIHVECPSANFERWEPCYLEAYNDTSFIVDGNL